MIRYYPSFAIKTNLSGGDKLVDAYGNSYGGKYYETIDGKFFSGPNPVIGPSEPLYKASQYVNSQGASSTATESPIKTTTGNEFLLDGAPYVGNYVQDPVSNNYYSYPSKTSQPPKNLSPAIYNLIEPFTNTQNKSLPEEKVDAYGKKLVLDPQNNLVPVDSEQDPQNAFFTPRILQPIAPVGADGSITRLRQFAIPPQDFLYGLKINPNFYGRPAPYQPKPNEIDYRNGYFFRYFVKKINENGYIIEISYQEFANINNGDVTYDVSLYKTQRTFWKLTGPLRTQRLAQYDIREGIIDTNKRLIDNLEKTYVGITAFIGGEYDKFSRPTK